MQFESVTPRMRLPISRAFTVAVLLTTLTTGALAQKQPPAPPDNKTPATKPATTTPDAKSVLMYKAQPGQTRRGNGAANLTLSPGGNKLVLEIKEVGKQTFTKVAPTGELTYEEMTESSETTVNGQKDPSPEEKKDTNTIVIKPNGLLVSYTSTKTDKDDVKFAARLFYATNPVFSEKPVGTGDKWTSEFKGNAELGTKDGKADYEIVDAKKQNDVDTVTVKFTYAEAGTGGISSKGTILIEKASGDTLAADIDIDGVPLGPAGQETPATGKLTSERLEGGPLTGSKNAKWLALLNPKAAAGRNIDDIVKDYEKLPGMLTLYRKKDANRDQIYLELPEEKLGKLFYLQATASTGSADEVIAGDPINDILFKFTKGVDDKIMMISPNWQFRTDPNTPLGRAAKRSFADGYLQTFRIEGKQPDRKSVLIDVTDLFRSDFAQISQFVNGGESGGLSSLLGMSGGGGFGMDREKTYIQSVKSFPENIAITTQYHFYRGRATGGSSALADPRSLPFVVAYNLIALPNDENYKPTNGYVPRKADGRVGYFTTDYTDFNDDTRDDFTERFILRWDLRKKDPTAALSEPVKPIVFWLDNAIPLEYREATAKGILCWNKAFEKIGFKDAIVVKQMPDNADWDHADLRYNIVRWVVSPEGTQRNGVSIALFRPNPLTGQILSATISIDASFTHFGKLEQRNLIEPASRFREGANMDMEDLLSGTAPLTDAVKAKFKSTLRQAKDPRYCEMGASLDQARLGAMALELLSPAESAPEREKEYTAQYLQEVVCHEMGHCLGLRHNFIASTELTLDQLKDPKVVREQGIGASVMDYNAFNVSAIGQKDVDFFSQTVGTYDNWAIAYGYSPFTEGQETGGLKQIAAQSSLPGHAFEEDYTAIMGLDPRVVRFDISGQPLDYWERMMQLSKKLMATLAVREPKQGESYWEFTRRLNSLLSNYARAAGSASRYIGGIKVNRNYKGDVNEQPTTVATDATEQKRALALLNTYVFSPTAITLPEQYYNHLTSDPFGLPLGQDQPIADQIARFQSSALQRIFTASVLRRIQNAEFKSASNPNKVLTLPTLFTSVRENIWAEVKPQPVAKVASADGRVPATKLETIKVPLLRRQLQRAYLDTMIDMATKPGASPDDAKMLAWEQLRQLKTRLAAVQPSQVQGDEYTRLHLRDAQEKINRALEAKLVLGQTSSSPSNSSLLQMLLGGSE